MWWRVIARVGAYRGPLTLAIFFSLFAASAGALWASLVGPLLRSLIGGGAITWGPFELQRDDLTFKLPLAIVAAAVLKAVVQNKYGNAELIQSPFCRRNTIRIRHDNRFSDQLSGKLDRFVATRCGIG